MNACERNALNPYLRSKGGGGRSKPVLFIDLALQIENLDVDSERVEANRIEFNEEVTAAQNLPVTFFDGLNGERLELIEFAKFEV